MSGGSFNYLYLHMEDEPFSHLGQLDDMVKFTLENSPEVGEELQKLQQYLAEVEQQVQARTKPLLEVMRAVEWWVSGDSGKDYLEQAWREYKDTPKFETKQDKKLGAYAAYVNGNITRAQLDEALENE